MIKHPEWTSIDERKGIDPLGMATSCINLYQTLLPGLSNITPRIRLYGFYAWLIDEYSTRHNPDPEEWRQHVRRAEALLALISATHGNELGIGGALWANDALENDASVIDLRAATESAEQYLNTRRSVFAGAYAPQLKVLDIICMAENHDIELITEGLGAELARGFRESVGEHSSVFIQTVDQGEVDRETLLVLQSFSPSEINFENGEVDSYKGLLFTAEDSTPESLARTQSMRLLLEVGLYEEAHFSVGCVRWHWLKAALAEPKTDDTTLRYWAIYHLNDMLQIAYNSLFALALDRLDSYPAGAAIDQWIAAVVAELFDETGTASDWASWTTESQCLLSTLRQYLNHLTRSGLTHNAEEGWKALTLIAQALHLGAAMRSDIDTVFDANSHIHSLATEMAYFDNQQKRPLKAVITDLINERVLRQHLAVAMRKLKDQGTHTFLFEMEMGRARLRRRAAVATTNPRLETAINFIKDLRLVKDSQLTDFGRATLKDCP